MITQFQYENNFKLALNWFWIIYNQLNQLPLLFKQKERIHFDLS